MSATNQHLAPLDLPTTPEFSCTPPPVQSELNSLDFNRDQLQELERVISRVTEIGAIFKEDYVTKSLILKDFYFRIVDPSNLHYDGEEVFSFRRLIDGQSKFSNVAKILPVFRDPLRGTAVAEDFQDHWFNLRSFVKAFGNMSDDDDKGYYTMYGHDNEPIDHFTPYGYRSSPENVLKDLLGYLHLISDGCEKIIYKKWNHDCARVAIPSDEVMKKIGDVPSVEELMQYPRFTAILNDGQSETIFSASPPWADFKSPKISQRLVNLKIKRFVSLDGKHEYVLSPEERGELGLPSGNSVQRTLIALLLLMIVGLGVATIIIKSDHGTGIEVFSVEPKTPMRPERVHPPLDFQALRCHTSRALGAAVNLGIFAAFIYQYYLSWRRLPDRTPKRVVVDVCRGVGTGISAIRLIVSLDAHTSFCTYGIYPESFPMIVHINTTVLVDCALLVWVYIVAKTLNERSGVVVYKQARIQSQAFSAGIIYFLVANTSLLTRYVIGGAFRMAWVPYLVFSQINFGILAVVLLHFAWRLTRMLTIFVGNLSSEFQEETLDTLKRFLIFTLLGVLFVILQNGGDLMWLVKILRGFDSVSGMAIPPKIVYICHTVGGWVILALFLWYTWIPFNAPKQRKMTRVEYGAWKSLRKRGSMLYKRTTPAPQAGGIGL
eukprot:338274_1